MSFRRSTRFLPAAILLGASLLAQRHVQAAEERLCFPEAAPVIQDCIEGRFAEYWRKNGGLPVFGYPLTSAREEVNRDTGERYLTQYFERQRFELHPENKAPYDVLMGRLGDDQLRQQGVDWHALPKADPRAARYVPETGHAIGEEFWSYYRSQGLDLGHKGISEAESLALFGHPISEPRMETNSSGDRVLTQYFERARLEVHLDKPKEHRILQGRVGDEVHKGQQGRPENLPVPPVSCLPTPAANGTQPPASTPTPPDCVPSAPEAGGVPVEAGKPAETPAAPTTLPTAPSVPATTVPSVPTTAPVPSETATTAPVPSETATTAPVPSETATPVPPVATDVPSRPSSPR